MAKLMNPLNSTEARGRVGGLVYNTWRGIRYVKEHTPPGHQDDPKRVAHKTIVQNAGIRWRSLSDAQRTAWDTFADLHTDISWTGSPTRLAGFHWYVRIQTRRQDMSQGYADNPPIDLCFHPLTDLAAVLDSGNIQVTWADDPFSGYTDHFVDVWITDPLSAGRNPSIHDAHRDQFAYFPDDFATISAPPAGTYTIFCRMARNNGMFGTWQSVRITVT